MSREQALLKKLRIKFIALNMVIAALVLTIAFGAITYLSYCAQVQEVYNALDLAIDRADAPGAPSHIDKFDNADAQNHAPNEVEVAPSEVAPSEAAPPDAAPTEATPQDAAPTKATLPDAAPSDATPPEIGQRFGDSRPLIPTAVFLIETDGTIHTLSYASTASLSEDIIDEAVSGVTKAASEGRHTTLLDAVGLYAASRTTPDGTYVAFADKSYAQQWQNLGASLLLVGLGALLVFFVISLFFSKWALRPVGTSIRQQQQFIADASHELKTPLTVILANTAILRGAPEATISSMNQWIDSTHTEAQRMKSLVGDMLDLARASEPTATPFTVIDLSDLVEGEALQFESIAFEHTIELTASIEPCISVMGDAAQLRRMMATLIDNACKYTPSGGHVSISLCMHNSHACLRVNNDGECIAKDDLAHLFDRFYRGDKTRDRSQESYGLGLAIASEIVNRHQGSISASSTAEEGTTFTVTLPFCSTR